MLRNSILSLLSSALSSLFISFTFIIDTRAFIYASIQEKNELQGIKKEGFAYNKNRRIDSYSFYKKEEKRLFKKENTPSLKGGLLMRSNVYHDKAMYTKYIAFILLIITMSVLTVSSSFVLVQAKEGQSIEEEPMPKTQYNNDLERIKIEKDEGEMPKVGLPNVKTQEIVNWTEQKGSELIDIVQSIGYPFFIITFMFGGFFLVTGLLGRSASIGKGLAMIFFSIIGYTAVIYAPEIVDWFMVWASE